MGIFSRAWSAVTYQNGHWSGNTGGSMTESAFQSMVKKAGGKKVGKGHYVVNKGGKRTEYRQY